MHYNFFHISKALWPWCNCKGLFVGPWCHYKFHIPNWRSVSTLTRLSRQTFWSYSTATPDWSAQTVSFKSLTQPFMKFVFVPYVVTYVYRVVKNKFPCRASMEESVRKNVNYCFLFFMFFSLKISHVKLRLCTLLYYQHDNEFLMCINIFNRCIIPIVYNISLFYFII